MISAPSAFQKATEELNAAAAASGFDYTKALSNLASVQTLDNTAARVRAIELFDLNGRRLDKDQKGITIVKKMMTDGSIRTEKVVVK